MFFTIIIIYVLMFYLCILYKWLLSLLLWMYLWFIYLCILYLWFLPLLFSKYLLGLLTQQHTILCCLFIFFIIVLEAAKKTFLASSFLLLLPGAFKALIYPHTPELNGSRNFGRPNKVFFPLNVRPFIPPPAPWMARPLKKQEKFICSFRYEYFTAKIIYI